MRVGGVVMVVGLEGWVSRERKEGRCLCWWSLESVVIKGTSLCQESVLECCQAVLIRPRGGEVGWRSRQWLLQRDRDDAGG